MVVGVGSSSRRNSSSSSKMKVINLYYSLMKPFGLKEITMMKNMTFKAI